MIISVDGVVTNNISGLDRGFLFGDAIFTTLLWEKGVPKLWDLHQERLHEGMKLFQISYDLKDCYKWMQESASSFPIARIRITLTRGEGEIGLYPQKCSSHLVMMVSPYVFPEEPIPLKLSSWIFREKPPLSCIKHTGYQLRILSRLEHPGFDSILFNEYGNVVGTTVGNIVVKKNNVLITPPLSDGALKGVMREHLLRTKKIEEGSLTLDDLQTSEIWITNALIGMKKAIL